MVVTVTNTSGGVINDAAVAEDGVSLPGGNHPEEASHRNNPLPFPFAHIGSLADTITSVFGMRPSDWDRQTRTEALAPSVKWSMLVQAGTVTMANAAEASLIDPSETFFTDL